MMSCGPKGKFAGGESWSLLQVLQSKLNLRIALYTLETMIEMVGPGADHKESRPGRKPAEFEVFAQLAAGALCRGDPRMLADLRNDIQQFGEHNNIPVTER